MYEYGTVGPIQRVGAFFGNLFPLPLKLSLGIIRENTCFPVQKLGFWFENRGRRDDAVPVVADPHQEVE